MSLSTNCSLKCVRAVSVCLLLFGYSARADDQVPLERYDRVVFLKTVKASVANAQGAYSSGFVVAHEKHHYVVTAKHMARVFDGNTELAYRSPTGIATWIPLKKLCKPDVAEVWRHHPRADVSVFRVDAEVCGPEVAKELNSISIQRKDLIVSPIARTTEVEIVGFPSQLGVSRGSTLSGIVFSGRIASVEIETPAEWHIGAAILASSPAGDGVSGGPVFLAAGKDNAALECIGLYYGVLADRSGAKLSVVTPIKNCIELIEGN